MSSKETRRNIIRAGQKAVDELIKVAEEMFLQTDLKTQPQLKSSLYSMRLKY
jgi:hypothetical protein